MQAIGIAWKSLTAPMASTRGFRAALVMAFLILAVIALGRISGIISPGLLNDLRAFIIMPGIPLLAIPISEMALRDGITHRTLLLPLLGPAPRPTLAVVRTLATGLILFTGVALLLLVARAVALAGFGGLGRELWAALLATLTYVALFGLLHLLTRRGLITGLAVLGILDYPLGRMPFAIRVIAPSFHVRVLSDRIDSFPLPIFIDMPAASVFTSTITLALWIAALTFLTAVVFARKNLPTLC